jgi:hypothetical protein
MGTGHPEMGTEYPIYSQASGAGTAHPATGTLNPRRFAYDYDTRYGGMLVGEADLVIRPGSFSGAVVALREYAPCELVTESTTGSYDLKERNDALALADVIGVRVLTINPRQTKNYRFDHGIEKTNLNDARAILAVSRMPRAHLTPMRPRIIAETFGVLARLVNMRRSDYKNSDGVWARQVLKAAGVKSARPWHLQHALIARDVVERGGNRAAFDFAVGTYGTGRPGMARASFMRDGIPKVAKKDPAKRKAALREMRRLSRRIFALVRGGAPTIPTTGTQDPRPA